MKLRWFVIGLGLTYSLVGGSHYASADSLQLAPYLGADIYEKNPDSNDGAEPQMRVGVGRHGRQGAPPGLYGSLRTVLAFDLGAVPLGSFVSSVTLTLTVMGGEGTPNVVELRQIRPDQLMTEGTQNANDPVPPPSSNGVTWNEVRPGLLWDTPGGDFLEPVLSFVSAPDIGNATPFLANPFSVTFGSTTNFRIAAQLALDSGAPLQLMLFSPSREAELPPLDPNVENFYRFASDDIATPGYRPFLTIEYSATVPEPSSFSLLGTGLLAWMMLGRKNLKPVSQPRSWISGA